MRNVLLPGLVAVLALGFTVPSADTAGSSPTSAVDGSSSAPGHAAETNPVGTMRWLPPTANESAPSGFGNERLVVTYDASLNDDGEPTDLVAQGPFGLRISTTALVNGETLEEFPLRMIDHSPHVRSLDNVGGEEFGDADEIFMGVSGDVRDGDCARLHDEDGPEGFSAAYTTTRVMPTDYEASDCELVGGEVVNEQDEVIGVEVTKYVAGFWIDVNWPPEQGPLGGSGHHFAEVWYGALVDTDGDGDGEWYTEVDTPGNSTSIGSPGNYTTFFDLEATPGGWNAPDCYDWPQPALPNSVDQVTIDLSDEDASTITFTIWPKGDWDMFVEGPGGTTGAGEGGGVGIEETTTLPFVAGKWTVRGCNFVGEPNALAGIALN